MDVFKFVSSCVTQDYPERGIFRHFVTHHLAFLGILGIWDGFGDRF